MGRVCKRPPFLSLPYIQVGLSFPFANTTLLHFGGVKAQTPLEGNDIFSREVLSTWLQYAYGDFNANAIHAPGLSVLVLSTSEQAQAWLVTSRKTQGTTRDSRGAALPSLLGLHPCSHVVLTCAKAQTPCPLAGVRHLGKMEIHDPDRLCSFSKCLPI